MPLLTHTPVRTSGVLPAFKTLLLGTAAITGLVAQRIYVHLVDSVPAQVAHAEARIVLLPQSGQRPQQQHMDGERAFRFYARVDVGQNYEALSGGDPFDSHALAELIHTELFTVLQGHSPDLDGAEVAYPVVRTRVPGALVASGTGFLMSTASYKLVLLPTASADQA
ncbi:MAG: hypothetical protein RhofKO_25890 [Rhodothermales bacterium]